MTSDRARISYDPSRAYHGVVVQQGRVSLEADWNEAQAIAAAQLQERTLDLVGRAGSPDRGYEISPVMDGDDATGDLLIGAGALYVGGQRVRAGQLARYGDQPDWADREGDPLWRAPAVPPQPRELLYLLAREQEVGAVEDPALRDVALGGPDTTQRLRIVRRVIRHATTARTWEEAWSQLVREQWIPRGFRLDDASRCLKPAARLQVTAHPEDGGEHPAGHGGYLGPNNQLIRVQIARVDEDKVPVLVWGYDNASFLYRLSSAVAGSSHSTLRLATAPVDAHHQPREHQVVEVLRSAAALTEDDYVAAGTGLLAKVTTAYSPDGGQIVIGTELPPPYRKSPGQGLPLYLRVWEGEVRCTPGEQHELGGGIRVRLDVPAGDQPGRYPVGAYWTIAVRPGVGPGAQGMVYPQRILDRPQPPDGPRQWLTPIAFVRWHPRAPQTEDCVPRFDGLVRAERPAGSFSAAIRPHEVGGGWGLQDAIDAHASREHPATISLAPGEYALPSPLRIGPEHGRLTLRAAAPGVILRAEPDAAARFLLGMIMVADTDGFTLEGLEIHLPHTRFALEQESYLSMPERARLVLDAHRDRVISIGLHAARCTGLSVDGCRFVFSPPGTADPDAPAHHRGGDLFAAGIFGAEELRGLRVTRCTFASTEPISHAHRRVRTGTAAGAGGSHHVAIGVVQVPTALAAAPPAAGEGSGPAQPRGSASIPLLADAVFDGNIFEQLTAPLVAIGQLGRLRLERNTVRDCHAGFWLVTQYGSYLLTLFDRLVNQIDDAYRDLVAGMLSALTEPLLFHATTLARMLPLAPPEDADAAARPRRLEPPSAADERDASELLHRLTAADAPPQARQAPAQRESQRRRFLDTFGRARTTRAQPEHVAVSSPAALRCDLTVSGNVLDCGDAPALVALDSALDSDASLVLTGNQLRGRPRPGAAVCLYLLPSCAVAANVIANAAAEDEGEASLVVLARRRHERYQTAVTGNVLVGRAHLPGRPDDLPSWESLNSVTR